MLFTRFLQRHSFHFKKTANTFLSCGLKRKSVNMTNISDIISNNKQFEETIASLKDELSAIRKEMIAQRKKQLILENAALFKQVEIAKAQLIALETRNGKRQILIPGVRQYSTESSAPAVVETAKTANESQDSHTTKQPKEKKPKKEKPAGSNAASAATAAAVEAPIDVGRLDMRVGKIIEVQRHPDADSLYLEKIDCGESQPRTVVSGLVKYVPIEEMNNRMVIVLCNLKPAKMRGVTSEAMVMCASTPDKVEILSPPLGAIPGDLVYCDGYTRNPDSQLNPKKKIFETCAPDLMTNDNLVACYKGAALYVPDKGNISAQTLRNVNVK